MSVTRAWKVYGQSGHRQGASFTPSVSWDFSSEKEGTRLLTVLNSDVTGTNDYSIIMITRNTAEECKSEFKGQVSDGYFENYRTGKKEEIKFDRT